MSKTRFWNEWRETTRLIKSAQIAFSTEIARWNDMNQEEQEATIIENPNQSYKVSVYDHIKSLSNEHLFSAVILQYSCGAVEEHGRIITKELLTSDKLQLATLRVKSSRRNLPLPIDDHITAYIQDNAIENWGRDLLQAKGLTWNDVLGGQPGMSEIMSIRNAIAHGSVRVNNEMIDRFQRYGGSAPWRKGSLIRLDLTILQEYRARLRSFCRLIND